MSVLVLSACGSVLREERPERPPLREVFPPPSVEAPQAKSVGSAPPAAPPSAPAAAAATPPQSPAEAAPQPEPEVAPEPATESPAAPPPTAAQETAALKPPRAAQPEAALAPPSLEAGGARSPATGEALPGASADLAREFEPVTSPQVEGQGTPAPVAAEPAPSAPGPAAAPRIIVSTEPAMLVSIQGQPTFGPVDGTKLQRVLNTPAFLVKGPSGNYYLSVYDGFMRAPKLTGPWTVMPEAPRVVQDAKARALSDGEADVLAGRPDPQTGQRPTLKQAAPRIIVTTQPSALVVIKGEPTYEPIEGTRLSRVVNTDARIFVNRPEDRTYVQVGERWYRAPSLKGPWESVDESGLPDGLEDAVGQHG